jgi:hypothetical protein
VLLRHCVSTSHIHKHRRYLSWDYVSSFLPLRWHVIFANQPLLDCLCIWLVSCLIKSMLLIANKCEIEPLCRRVSWSCTDISNNIEEHIDHVDNVLTLLNDNSIRLRLSKCFFAKKELEYLRHMVSVKGLKPTNSKIDKGCPIPRRICSLVICVRLVCPSVCGW